MQFGHFDDANREYVITRPDTPRPWSNYLGSTEYGGLITNHAGGYSFYRSGGTGKVLRMRFNNVPIDMPGRLLYLRDNETKDFWSLAWQPVGKDPAQYKSTCRHGTGYTVITSGYAGIASETTYLIPLEAKFEYWRTKLKNTSSVVRKLSLFTYCEFTNMWGTWQDTVNLQYSMFITRAAKQGNCFGYMANPNGKFDGDLYGCNRSWMSFTGNPIAGWETSREKFLGMYGTYAAPKAVITGQTSDTLAEGENMVGGIKSDIILNPGEEIELFVLLGVGTIETHGAETTKTYANAERFNLELEKLKAHWHGKLENLQVVTPDPAFNSMVNVWNAYNNLVTYHWARSASMIYCGDRDDDVDAVSYRDVVQDMLGAATLLGSEIKPKLTQVLKGQFSYGGAMPTLKPMELKPGTIPPCTRHRSDDALWLFNTIPAYLAETGDIDFLQTVVPFADRGEGTVFEHLKRAVEFSLNNSGAHGLPCGLLADWNDCVSLGKGESIFVAFQLRYALKTLRELAALIHEPSGWMNERLTRLDENIQKHCWDGDWFVWAFGLDGVTYGSKSFPEGQIYINSQSWAVISEAATGAQATKALDSMATCFTKYGLTLFEPPFKNTSCEIMKGGLFNQGIKENAGIFSHAQTWAIMAETMQGNGDRAYQYYKALNPATYNEIAEERQVEPYVHCQTSYSKHNISEGIGRVPWLTGTVSWAYFVATQHILGIRPEYDGITIDPCIPRDWPSFTVRRKFRHATLLVTVKNDNRSKGVKHMIVNGVMQASNFIPLDQLTAETTVEVFL